ncbi:biotin/lipoyl-binding protein [Fredinandcohnia quinoae]|uniref:Biotin/lipoyl-binding protein n=1 Tax=Fredinandcohnia quinoae TaxID=2918902 RepID=A0AAW5DYR1_9BACI|nr:biotin/lipoyl-binding protein [Fredinandcohnia sp. SECRCQ15]
MEYDEIVTSPYHGKIKAIPIQEDSLITEWEPLFIIQSLEGENKTIAIGISGRVQSIEVQEGDEVIPGMVLAYLREDSILIGAD